jgi:DNA-binding transcriptional LysR family regulator
MEAEMSVVALKAKPDQAGSAQEFRIGAGLELDLLRTLVAIADTGSFNRAARAVFRTPSAVSMQMKKLEEQVGQPLFAKNGRSVVLTPDGEALLGYARRILKLADEALLRFRAPEIRGTIRLGAPDDYASLFLPDILSRFAASHPNVEVDVVCQSSGELVTLLEDRSLDVALISAGHGQASGGVTVYREDLGWVGLKHGCAHEKNPIPLAISHVGCCWRRQALDALDRAGVAYRIAYTSKHYVGQLAAVMAGLAIAPFPLSSLSGELKILGEESGLPRIGRYEIELHRSPAAKGPLFDALACHIEGNFRGYEMAAA